MATAELHSPMLPQRYRTSRARRELQDTFTLDLEPADGGPPMAFAPGQFNMVYAFGVGEVPISISGDPASGRLIHTIRVVGAATKALCQAKPGTVLGIRGPYGVGWPVREAEGKDVLIVAGGIGLAPLRPTLYHIVAHRRDYGRVILLMGARTPADLLFPGELERWRGRFDLDVQVTVDAGDAKWSGDVGFVTTLLSKARFDPTNALAMICGPEVMMRFSAAELLQRELPVESIYLSMERNMKCAVGFCGHCQYGPTFICKDGPVFRYDRIQSLMAIREV